MLVSLRSNTRKHTHIHTQSLMHVYDSTSEPAASPAGEQISRLTSLPLLWSLASKRNACAIAGARRASLCSHTDIVERHVIFRTAIYAICIYIYIYTAKIYKTRLNTYILYALSCYFLSSLGHFV